ncbi:arylesterase [Salipiger sp. IMCC34102]|uniref:arylesterase n=1 Tax=Salipiger sp. IMCC34102 TaxID=2510647 RepID=UPI00101C82FD|nr:arylesterase [Salipiger sp. IMCC34102]RYH02155.1 arylesterase [Salipiger sp. IMCC34102]
MGEVLGGSALGYGAWRVFRNACALVFIAAPGWAEPVTVAALGDSLTAGYGLPRAQGFVPQMQAWLDEAGAEVVLVNAGVSGDTTAGGLSRLDWTLTPDVDGLIVALGGNDYLRALDPAVSGRNLDAILSGAQARDLPALLIGIEAGANYGPEFQTAFNGMYRDLARTYDVPLIPDWFDALQAEGQDPSRLLQSDGVHPNAAGVSLIVAAMGPVLLDFVEGLEP